MKIEVGNTYIFELAYFNNEYNSWLKNNLRIWIYSGNATSKKQIYSHSKFDRIRSQYVIGKVVEITSELGDYIIILDNGTIRFSERKVYGKNL
jgi:hypothetical protein